MAGTEDLEARVVRLEQDVARLQERVAATSGDAAAARVLAGGADRDVAEIRTEIREGMRGHTQALNALRENQLEMQSTLLDHSAQSSSLNTRFTSLDTRLTSLETRVTQGFAEMRSGMGQIVTLLGGTPPA